VSNNRGSKLNLTEVAFWENYWRGVKLPAKVDLDFSFDRCLSKELAKHFPKQGEIFEIGCAPGKWLSYAANDFGLIANGIEYSSGGVEATIKNFQLLNVPHDSLIVGDFFSQVPDKQYDVVMSLGFIEHFDNVHDVVELHLKWLKPNGILILGVPNFSGINAFLQSILDQEILDKHNLTIMNLPFFKQLGAHFKLEEISVKYTGSFEPALPIPRHRIGNPLQFLIRCGLFAVRMMRKIHLTDKLNGSFFSSYILAVYKK